MIELDIGTQIRIRRREKGERRVMCKETMVLGKIKIEKGTKVKIWVDDIREVPEGYVGTKSVEETIRLIEEIEEKGGMVELLDLDHDLGDYAQFGGDAIKILDYLVERETFYPILIHTANPVGRANMIRMIDRYWP